MGFTNITPAPTETPVSDKDGRMSAVWAGWYAMLYEQLRNGEFRLPQSEIDRILAESDSIAPPDPPFVPNLCTGSEFWTTLTWAVGNSGIITSAVGFDPGTNWILEITTPASGNFIGSLAFYEYGGTAGMKHAVLSTSPCGTGLIPAVDIDGFYPVVRFQLGTTAAPVNQWALLQTNKKYYFSLQTDTVGGTAVEMTITAA